MMCVTCGCGQADGKTVTIDGGALGSRHHEGRSGAHHHHDHPESDEPRRIRLERDLLAKNNGFAEANRRFFQKSGTFVVNLVSSPGSGKTTLLARTAAELKSRIPVAVIEGDQQTSLDAERIRDAGVSAVQINTGRVCHLDAHMVGHAVETLDLAPGGALFIENVGNLVCPAEFDLGEDHKVVVASVAEGEDKPLKYPHMFAAASLVLLNKIDLLPHLDFDVDRLATYARQVNPEIEVLEISASTGEGLHRWYGWLDQGIARVMGARHSAPYRSAG